MAVKDIGVRLVIEGLSGFLSGMDQYNAKLKTAEAATQRFAERAGRAGRALTALSAPLVGLGFVATRTFGEFEQSMARVQAVSGATEAELAQLEDQARRMGETTVFSAREAAGALAFMAQAGLTVTEQMTALPEVLNLAAAGQLDLATSADIVTNILAGQRLEASELAGATDVLVKAFTSANTNLIQLGAAFKFAGPVATAAGVSFAEQAAVLGILGDAGIQASLAGTSLRGAIARLLSPSKEAADILERMGVNALNSQGELRSMADIVDDLNAAGAGAAEILEIFGLRAGPAMTVLLAKGGDALREFTAELADAGGTAQRVAETQIDTLRGDLTLMTSAAEGAQIGIGEALAPALRALTRVAIPVINFIGAMATRFPVLTALVVGASVVIGLLGIALLGLSFILPGLVFLFPLLASGISLAAIASGALAIAMSPITLIVLGITAAVVAGIVVWKNWRSIIESIARQLTRVLGPLIRLSPIGGIGSLPSFGHGGTQVSTGPALVGERGPEIVTLPAGAQVAPTSTTNNFNVQAQYTNPQDPQTIRLDLEALAMATRS